MESVGTVLIIVASVLGIAALGGAIVYRFKSGGESEAIESYQNAVDAYQAEVKVLTIANTRQAGEIAELKAKAEASAKQLHSNEQQIQMLSRMVTGVEAIGNLELKLDGQFKGVHDHLNRLMDGKS